MSSKILPIIAIGTDDLYLMNKGR